MSSYKGLVEVPPDRTFGVSPEGEQFFTIAAALAAAALSVPTPSTANPALVVVYPGNYPESVTVPDGVILEGVGQPKITGALATGPRVTLGNGSIFNTFNVEGPTDATAAVLCAGGAFDVSQCRGVTVNGNGATSIGFQCLSGIMALVECDVTGTAEKAFSGGGAFFGLRDCSGNGTLTYLLHVTGSGQVGINSLLATGGTVGTGLFLGASIIAESISVNDEGAASITVGMSVEADGIDIRISDSIIQGSTSDFRVDSGLVGTNTRVSFFGCRFRREQNLDVPVAWFAGAVGIGLFYDEGSNEDDTTRFFGPVAIGTPGASDATYIGEGDPTSIAMFVLSDDGAGSFVDNTAAAKSKTGSTFELWQGTTAGNIAYFGNAGRQFSGVDMNLTVAMVPGAGAIVWEYWNGATWTAFNVMAALVAEPNTQFSDVVFERVANDYNTFDQDINANWAQVAVNGITAFWVRVRITTGITTAPTAQRVLFEVSTTTISAQGFGKRFGAGQQFRDIELGEMRSFTGGGSPLNLNVVVSASVTYGGVDNGYRTGDGVVFRVVVPEGLDTSRKVRFRTRWKPSSTNTGNVNWRLIVIEARTGDVIAGALPEVIVDTIVAASGVTDALQAEVIHSFSIPDVVPGDELIIAHTRDATSDTFTGTAEVIGRSLGGFFWH